MTTLIRREWRHDQICGKGHRGVYVDIHSTAKYGDPNRETDGLLTCPSCQWGSVPDDDPAADDEAQR